MNPDDGDLYSGLSGITFEVDHFYLDGGVTISTTFAHLMCPFILAFSPAPQGQAHPGPWKEAEGGFGFDLAAEIFVPKKFNWPKWFDRANTIRWIAALLRLRATPRLVVPVLSNVSFSKAASTDQEVGFWPVESESERTRMVLDPGAGHRVTLEHLEWVRQHWIKGGHLMQESSVFDLVMAAFDNCSFGRNPALALLQLWGALEAPGAERHPLQKRVAKLYESWSAAAHGGAKNIKVSLSGEVPDARRVGRGGWRGAGEPWTGLPDGDQ